ncbi:dTMP kinase [Nitrincola sp. MINF-07-Sa-05]|uniref:dTMP kinase n=1 Tax=Nitrincola salilacus TaxID=3400273 RepID=UPI003917BCBC
MTKGRFILIEGFDGVGKTTLSLRIADRLGYEYHKSPEGAFLAARATFDTSTTETVDRLSYYSGVALRNSIITEQRTASGINVIMDRYYHSSIAYHYDEYYKQCKRLKHFYEALFQPDLIFCIELDFKTIKDRKNFAGHPTLPDDEIFIREDLHQNITKIYRTILPDSTIFISNTDAIEIVENEILKTIIERL